MAVSNQGTTTYGYDANGNRTSETDPLGRTTSYGYSAGNQLVSVTGPTESGPNPPSPPMTLYAYDAAGNLTDVTDPLGRTKTLTYDAQNRVTSQLSPDPDGAGPLTAPLMQFAYDPAGRQTELTDPAGNVTAYEYDHAGRLVTATDPLLHVTQYEYDGAGQLTGLVDRNGRHRTFTYNGLGQRTSEVWLDSEEDPIRVMTWSYGSAGELIEASDPDSTYAYTYDVGGEVTSVDNDGTPGVPNVVLNFSYDFAGNRTSLSDNLGGSTAYTYTDHRLTGLSTVVAGQGEEWTQLAVALSYDSIGRLVGVTRSESGPRLDELLEPYQYSVGGVETEYSYDLYDNLLDITHESVDNGVSTTLSEFGYTYGSSVYKCISAAPCELGNAKCAGNHWISLLGQPTNGLWYIV